MALTIALLGLAGAGLITAGVFLLAGLGWSLVAGGVFVLAGAVVLRGGLTSDG